MPRIVEPDEGAIAAAAEILREGGAVAFPTETVYGLGADTFNARAVLSVYELKQRPADRPLSALVTGPAQAEKLTSSWDDRCRRLAGRFWPGPMTLVLPRHPEVPDSATAGINTIAVRCPRNDIAQSLLEAFGWPISAASANRSGGISPTLASHVAGDFPNAPELMVLDGGRCKIGIESTVLDLTRQPPRILRLGAISAGELRELIGEVATPGADAASASRAAVAPHYAPRTSIEIVEPEQLAECVAEESRQGRRVVVLCFDKSGVRPPHEAIEMPQGAGEYAQVLYEALHKADSLACDRIIVEEPPASNEMWKVVRNRLKQSTSHH
ncbi:MAG: threonylcarbamoyl-AMP synthase [Phycisphaerales bacterium]|nr:MAG: threonylcarbamoyl-AMP synthase [Phycisphaerales bacterium]